MNHLISKRIRQVICTLALCTTTVLGSWAKQAPAWTRNLEFSIETGVVMPYTFYEEDEQTRFQAALKGTLAAAFKARDNLEDIMLYVFATGDRDILCHTLYLTRGNSVSYIEAWTAAAIQHVLESDPYIRPYIRHIWPDDYPDYNDQSPHTEVSSDYDYKESVNLRVMEPDSGITEAMNSRTGLPVLEVSDEQDSHSCSSSVSSTEPTQARKNAFLRFMATLSGQERFRNVARNTLFNPLFKVQSCQLNQREIEALAQIITQLQVTQGNLVIQQAIRYKLGLNFGYGFLLNDSRNSPKITPKIGIDWISVRKSEIPMLGLTFKEMYAQIPIAVQFRWPRIGFALGYEFDWLISRSYHAAGYQPQFKLLPCSENSQETVTGGCLEKLGRTFCQMDLHFFRGAYLSCKIYLREANSNFGRNLTALVNALGTPAAELNIGLDLLKLFKKS